MSKYYLVSVDTFECVYFRAILGVAETKCEVLELLCNYYLLSKKNNNLYSFEGDTNDINILKIGLEDYEYLLDVYKNNEEIIAKNREEFMFKRGTVEDLMTNFWGLTLNIDADKPAKKELNDPNFYKLYKKICNEGKQVLI